MLRHAAVERGDAREIHVARSGLDDVAEHDMSDFVALHVRARHGFAYDARAEVGRREVLQRAAEIADRTPLTTTSRCISSLRWLGVRSIMFDKRRAR